MVPPRRNYSGDRGPMASGPGPRPSDTTRQTEPSLLRRQTLEDCVQQRRASEAQLNRELSPSRPARLGKTPQTAQAEQQLRRAQLERQLEHNDRAECDVRLRRKLFCGLFGIRVVHGITALPPLKTRTNSPVKTCSSSLSRTHALPSNCMQN